MLQATYDNSGFTCLGYAMPADFSCWQSGSIYACRGKNADVKYAFKTLQAVVKQVMLLLAESGKLAVPANPAAIIVDGDIGNTTATATQIVAASFVRNPEIARALQQNGVAIPPEIGAILADNLSSQELVRRVASGADQISNFLKYVAENFPVISREPVVIQVPRPPTRITPFGLAVIGGGTLAFAGLLASVIKKGAV